MLRLRGCGLPNVYLENGYEERGEGDAREVAYEDGEGLFEAIARAIVVNRGAMTKDEFRFLRKHLGFTQESFGALVGKTGQVVAKWEKGDSPVPLAEAKLIRIHWAVQSKGKYALARVESVLGHVEDDPVSRYVLCRRDGAWASKTRMKAEEERAWAWTQTQALMRTTVASIGNTRLIAGTTNQRELQITGDGVVAVGEDRA